MWLPILVEDPRHKLDYASIHLKYKPTSAPSEPRRPFQQQVMPTSTIDTEEAQDHYTVLSLPHTPPPSEKAIRNAYRRALLLHHPDKSKSYTTTTSSPKFVPSIDHITTAYKTLIDPLRRQDYDRRTLLTTSSSTHRSTTATAASATAEQRYPGLETVDLNEMNFVSATDDPDNQEGGAGGGGGEGGIYWRGCRCGRTMAFEIPEKELEAYAEDGEIVTGCQGCSLWLRVLFASVEADGDENKGDDEEDVEIGQGRRRGGSLG